MKSVSDARQFCDDVDLLQNAIKPKARRGTLLAEIFYPKRVLKEIWDYSKQEQKKTFLHVFERMMESRRWGKVSFDDILKCAQEKKKLSGPGYMQYCWVSEACFGNAVSILQRTGPVLQSVKQCILCSRVFAMMVLNRIRNSNSKLNLFSNAIMKRIVQTFLGREKCCSCDVSTIIPALRSQHYKK